MKHPTPSKANMAKCTPFIALSIISLEKKAYLRHLKSTTDHRPVN